MLTTCDGTNAQVIYRKLMDLTRNPKENNVKSLVYPKVLVRLNIQQWSGPGYILFEPVFKIYGWTKAMRFDSRYVRPPIHGRAIITLLIEHNCSIELKMATKHGRQIQNRRFYSTSDVVDLCFAWRTLYQQLNGERNIPYMHKIPRRTFVSLQHYDAINDRFIHNIPDHLTTQSGSVGGKYSETCSFQLKELREFLTT